MGLIVFRHIDGTNLSFLGVFKYASLFVCVLLLKSFHYLSAIRVKKFINNNNLPSAQTLFNRQSIKVLIGMFLLTLIDFLLIYKFTHDNLNTMSIIFGYEILNLFPLILLSLFRFTTSMFFLNYGKQSILKSRIILEFLINLARFSLLVIYTWFFNLHFTFPVHIIPSSYKCFRLLLTKTKDLVAYKRDVIKFNRFDQSLKKVSVTNKKLITDRCFCLEELKDDSDLRILSCDHIFHYECLKWWLIKSKSCPMCREEVHLHKQVSPGKETVS